MKRILLLLIAIFAGIATVYAQSEVDTHFNNGIHNIEAENYEVAIEAFTQVIILDPEYSDAYFNRGLAAFLWMDYESIFRTRSTLTAIVISTTEAGNGIEAEDIIDDFTQVIEFNPDDLDAYYLRGLVKYYSYDTAQFPFTLNDALDDFDSALEIDPAYQPALNAKYAVLQEITSSLTETTSSSQSYSSSNTTRSSSSSSGSLGWLRFVGVAIFSLFGFLIRKGRSY